jgi:hypothetical protein
MSIECPNCHTANSDAAFYCHRCGTRLVTEPAAPAEPDELAGYAPPPAASLESTPPPSPVGAGWQPAPQTDEATAAPKEVETLASDATEAAVVGRGWGPSVPQADQTEAEAVNPASRPRQALGCLIRIAATVALSYLAWSASQNLSNLLALIVLVLSLGTIALLWRGPLMDRLSGARPANRGQVSARGEVHDFRERVERSQTNNPFATQKPDVIIWTFRLERYEEGQRLPPIPVEMRGTNFSGFINNGDTIELLEKWREGRLHRTGRVYNVTSGGVAVTARKRARLDASAFVTILIILAIVFVIILGILNEIS